MSALINVPRERVRLLAVDAVRERTGVTPFASLPSFLRAGDVVVVNDAATLPASVRALTESGAELELRLFDPHHWGAVVLGGGDWRTRTEDRPAPPVLREGESLTIGDVSARVTAISPQSNRLLRLVFDAPAEVVWRNVYQRGVPVQYAHRPEPESLWAFQNVYSSRPWAAEQASAGRALTWEMLLGLRRSGIRVVALTEGAGLSSSGESKLDASLPLPERYEIPSRTAKAVNEAVAEARRVIAVGTSVMRALESNARAGVVEAKEGTASLIIDGTHRRQVVSGLLTGIHSPQESHYRLLQSLVSPALLARASDHARLERLQEHEAGDAMLLLASSLEPRVGVSRAV